MADDRQQDPGNVPDSSNRDVDTASQATPKDVETNLREMSIRANKRIDVIRTGPVCREEEPSVVETLWALIGVAVGLAGVAQWLSSGEEGEERMTHAKAEREAVDRAMTVGGMSVGEARKDAPTAAVRPQGAA